MPRLTMRTINIRFLLVSAGLIAIVSVGANLLHGIQLRHSAGILLEQGTRKIKEGRPGDALGYLVRYALLAPHNAEAQILLADTLAEMRHVDPAIRWYERALLRDASRHEARRRLVELAIAARRFPAAKAHLVDFLLPYTPDDPQIYYLLGVCHEGLGEYGPAIQRLREAIDRDPAIVEAYALLATLLRDQREGSVEADAIMDQLVTRNPSVAKALIARADYRAKYRLSGVLDDVRDAVRLAPEDTEILFRAATTALDLAIESNDREALLSEAEGYLQNGLARQPRYPGWYLGLAQADRSRGDIAKAIAHAEEGLSAVPNNGDLQWNLADMMIQQDRFDEGLGIVDRLRDQGYPKVPLEYLVALADARRMRFVDASERWRSIRGQMEQWPKLARQTEYWLGICYERLGEYGLQLTAFRNAVKIDPAWVPARQWLANALARTGRLEEAIIEYEELAKITGVPGSVYRELAKLLVLRELQRRDPQWQRVLAFLDHAAKLDPDADDYTILQAEVQAARQEHDAARQTLSEGMRDNPDSIAIRLALAALEQSAEQWDVADRLIAETQDRFGETVEIRLARLRYLVQRYGTEAYDELQELEKDPPDGDVPRRQQWRSSLAAAYYTLGKYEDAGRLWQQAVDEEPDNIRLRMFLFDLALADADDVKMQQLLADIRRIERSDEQPLWRYGEATRLVVRARKGDASALEQAERLLEEVRAARQAWSRVPLLQAEIDEIHGRHDKVVEHYLSAIDLGERSPTIIRRVVELLYRQRRYVDADSVLRRFEATQLPITGELGRLAADVSFRVQDFSRAMQIAVQVIGNSESYEDLVWMAQLHSVMDQSQLAEEKLRAAIKKQPKAPDAWIALVQHYVRTDSPDKARLATKTLTSYVQPDAVAFIEAICLNALGDDAEALRKFHEATRPKGADAVVLRVAANFFLSRGLPRQGEPLLRRLLIHSAAAESDISWARRNLAMVWAATGDHNDREEALKLVNMNLQQSSSSIEDRRAKALCLAALGGNAGAEAALDIIESLVGQQQSTPSDQLLAYQLCVKLNRRPDAREYLQQHTFENSNDPQNLVRYIHFVMADDEFHEARLWLDRLEKLCLEGIQQTEGSMATAAQHERFRRYYIAAIGLSAQLLAKQGNSQAALAEVAGRVDSGNNANSTALSSLEAAQLLISLARQSASLGEPSADEFRSTAESLLRSTASRSSQDAVALVALLAQQNRLKDAVSVWNAYFREDAADQFSITAAALAAHPMLDSKDLVQLTERVKGVPAERRTKPLLAGLAQLFTFQGQHTEAIAVHREMLANDPADIVAANNLACYLALSGTDRKEALQLIDNAITSAGPVASLLDSRGMILLELDRPGEALRDLTKAIEMDPNGAMYLHLAAAHKRLKQDQQSADAMERAREAGLNVEMLHPLERTRYQELLKQATL